MVTYRRKENEVVFMVRCLVRIGKIVAGYFCISPVLYMLLTSFNDIAQLRFPVGSTALNTWNANYLIFLYAPSMIIALGVIATILYMMFYYQREYYQSGRQFYR